LRRLRKSLIFNATTLIVLRELECLDLLEEIQRLCDVSVIIPQGVVEEFQKTDAKLLIPNATVVEVQREELTIDIPRSLGRGELQAIIIAYTITQERESHRNVTFVVTDDKRARNVCKKLGIKVIGTLGLIELAKKCKVISKEKAIELLNKIPSTSLYITPELLSEAQLKIKQQQ